MARWRRPERTVRFSGHYEAEAVRTEAGWRIRTFVFDLVRYAGGPPAGKI